MSIKKVITPAILVLIWSLYYFAAGLVNKVVPSVITGVVIIVSVFVMLTVSMSATRELKDLKVKCKALWLLVLIGVFGFLLDLTAFIGFKYVPGGIVTVLLKVDIIYVLIISAVVFKEKIPLTDWISVIVMLVGIFLITDISAKSLAELPVWIVKTVLLLNPVLNLFYDFIFLGKKPSSKSLIGILIVMTSTAFIVFGQSKQYKKELVIDE